jgi:hypothetical protein
VAGLVCWLDGELGGGRAKISQPPPASTVRVPRILARVARVASASSLERMAWAPLIMAAALKAERETLVEFVTAARLDT